MKFHSERQRRGFFARLATTRKGQRRSKSRVFMHDVVDAAIRDHDSRMSQDLVAAAEASDAKTWAQGLESGRQQVYAYAALEVERHRIKSHVANETLGVREAAAKLRAIQNAQIQLRQAMNEQTSQDVALPVGPALAGYVEARVGRYHGLWK